MTEMKQFNKGDVIFKEGQCELCMYEIASGAVDIFLHYGQADERKLTTVKTNGIFGELGLIDYYPRSATAVAAEDTKVTVIDDDGFVEYLSDKPELKIMLIRSISDRIRALSEEYEDACHDIAMYYGSEAKDISVSLKDRIKKMISFGKAE